MKPITINTAEVDRVRAHWSPEKAVRGNKVKAIKELREITGMGLKESKDIIESGFDPGMLTYYKVEINPDEDDPQYWIDRLVKLSYDMHVCHENLARLGCKMRGT